jgi:hypothetical protein
LVSFCSSHQDDHFSSNNHPISPLTHLEQHNQSSTIAKDFNRFQGLSTDLNGYLNGSQRRFQYLKFGIKVQDQTAFSTDLFDSAIIIIVLPSPNSTIIS